MPRNRSGPQSGSSMPDPSVLARDADATSPGIGLPVLTGPAPVRERADAARNRLRVLAAAERLFAERGVAGVTMDDIAGAAGVGKGTLYRRFTDKAGLANALLSERGVELQQRLMSGPPPFGPGGDPVDRIRAFTRAYLTFQARHIDLVLMSETGAPGGRLRKPSYDFWRQHVVILLRSCGAPDPSTRAEVLLAGLSAEQVEHWMKQGRDLEALGDQLAGLAEDLASVGRR